MTSRDDRQIKGKHVATKGHSRMFTAILLPQIKNPMFVKRMCCEEYYATLLSNKEA